MLRRLTVIAVTDMKALVPGSKRFIHVDDSYIENFLGGVCRSRASWEAARQCG